LAETAAEQDGTQAQLKA
jgi:hypothetical protein